jgi:hypothetical protein
MKRFNVQTRRRGSAYVLVLGISLLVGVIGVAALTAVRVQIRTAANTSDSEEARIYAQSGVELARLWVNDDVTDWRTKRVSGAPTTLPLGSGTVSVTLTDPVDGDLANSPLDPVLVTATGYKGRARQQVLVTLRPAPIGYSCLNAALTANGAFVTSAGRVTGWLVATNATMSVTGSAVMDANTEAVGSFTGTAYLGSKTPGVAARKMPDATAFDYYVQNGTAIPYASLALGELNGVLLSPANNPFGPTNPNGIYVIDCAGNTIYVRNVRVVGTLVILNCKLDSAIDAPVNLSPAVANFPALMVKGSIAFQYGGSALSEAAGKNYNPPGTPDDGVSNLTTTDTYPSIIDGLTYVSGNLTLGNGNALGGPLVVGGTVTSAQNLSLRYDTTYLTNPPPGFFDPPPMKVLAGTWAQGVN